MRKSFSQDKSSGRFQLLVYIILSGAVLLLTALNTYSGCDYFSRYFGALPPVLILGIFSIIGGAVSLRLWSKFGYFILKPSSPRLKWSLLLCVLGSSLVAILVDLNVGFEEDINAPFPCSLLFYPTIGFFVEVLFHILPLIVLFNLASHIFQNHDPVKNWWPYIGLVALIEPTFQVFFMGEFSIGSIIVVWLNIYFFNLVQLYTYSKYGFVSMYLLRIVYYFIWHIVWGFFRLEILF